MRFQTLGFDFRGDCEHQRVAERGRPLPTQRQTLACHPEKTTIRELISVIHHFLAQEKDDLIKTYTQPIRWRRVIKVFAGILIYLAIQQPASWVAICCNSSFKEHSGLFEMLSTTSRKKPKAGWELVLDHILAFRDGNTSRASRR